MSNDPKRPYITNLALRNINYKYAGSFYCIFKEVMYTIPSADWLSEKYKERMEDALMTGDAKKVHLFVNGNCMQVIKFKILRFSVCLTTFKQTLLDTWLDWFTCKFNLFLLIRSEQPDTTIRVRPQIRESSHRNIRCDFCVSRHDRDFMDSISRRTRYGEKIKRGRPLVL